MAFEIAFNQPEQVFNGEPGAREILNEWMEIFNQWRPRRFIQT